MKWRLRRCASVGRDVRVRGDVQIRGPGEVVVGDRVVLDGARAPIELHAKPGAKIVLEADVVVGAGTSIEACESVVVGEATRIGEFCKLLDNSFHALHGERSRAPASERIVVGAHAEIGVHALLLPGARIGDDAWVRSGSVVSRVVPAGATARGAPATVVRAS
ncbi:MAG: acyltransferase [Polyangiales bacterium]